LRPPGPTYGDRPVRDRLGRALRDIRVPSRSLTRQVGVTTSATAASLANLARDAREPPRPPESLRPVGPEAEVCMATRMSRLPGWRCEVDDDHAAEIIKV
jgi:hypothetical protein